MICKSCSIYMLLNEDNKCNVQTDKLYRFLANIFFNMSCPAEYLRFVVRVPRRSPTDLFSQRLKLCLIFIKITLLKTALGLFQLPWARRRKQKGKKKQEIERGGAKRKEERRRKEWRRERRVKRIKDNSLEDSFYTCRKMYTNNSNVTEKCTVLILNLMPATCSKKDSKTAEVKECSKNTFLDHSSSVRPSIHQHPSIRLGC
ncbi:hypothetical protein AMECASPLE_007447 [Ameca splendens]|uniref:Uncharacterized protein n=1 Tax=Ameca splendens TaxID=208324 RepID=A0ABV1A7C0_9TELE